LVDGIDVGTAHRYTLMAKKGITIMANIKTAISLQEPLFDQVEILAREMKVSRSRLFALALEEFIRHHQNQRLLEKINQAYAASPDPAEQKHLRAMRRQHRKIVEGEW